MAWIQLKTPRLDVVGAHRLCLKYTREAYGIAAKYLYAWKAWQGAKQHTEALPNVSVPVFFSWSGNLHDGQGTKNYGDVAVWVPGRGVIGVAFDGASHRWDPTPQARAAAMGGGARYVGWSEDLNGVPVVKWVADPKPTPAPSGQPMPPKGGKVRITINRTGYFPGTDKVKGTLKPGGGYDYIVRDIRGYRVLLQSASAGGLVEVALYYKNGQRIEGWS